MAISIVLRTQAQREARRSTVAFHVPRQGFDARRFPLLSGVDPVGVTVFNARQMQHLGEEIDALLTEVDDPAVLAGARELKRFAEELRRPPHRLVWLIGEWQLHHRGIRNRRTR